ncbi:hypothetical protein POM88_037490 [Heracleum sosnowskyi]|uniref:EDS1 EP domain-containing protein n=1 Tax=Heracleum sosnowskyi TaxID=360622 RepID=A0AAD8HS55_9APIA|nr:hypothetical protein POM88_037490 [Heracleum sosnowskyi]
MAYMEWYKKLTRTLGSSYDTYKSATTSGELRSRASLVKHQRILTRCWTYAVNEAKKTDGKYFLFHLLMEGNNYRRMVEPLDIAEFYKVVSFKVSSSILSFQFLPSSLILMASKNNLIQAMNNVTLEDEEEGGIEIQDMEDAGESEMLNETEIVKPYGTWMMATLRKQTKLVGSRWLRSGNGEDEGDRNMASVKPGGL